MMPLGFSRNVGRAFFLCVLMVLIGNARASAMSDERPALTLGLKVGCTFGGANLISGTYSTGETASLNAGELVFASLVFAGTPLWFREGIGVGAGFEAGSKIGALDGANGGYFLSRYPIVGSVHVAWIVQDHVYLLLAGGITKDLAVNLHGNGDFAGPDIAFDSSVGGMGEMAAYLRMPHSGLVGSLGLRYTRLRYSVAGESYDASSVGFVFGIHYEAWVIR